MATKDLTPYEMSQEQADAQEELKQTYRLQADFLKDIAESSIKQVEMAEEDQKQAKKDKKDSIVKKSFGMMKEVAGDAAGSNVSKTLGRGLLDATATGRFLGMINDATGIGDKAFELTKKGFNNLFDREDKRDEENEEDDDSLDDLEEYSADTVGELEKLNTTAIEIKTAVGALTSMASPKTDKDVLAEETIQAEKDRILFIEMRDLLEDISKNEDDAQIPLGDSKKKEDEGGFFSTLMGTLLAGPLKKLFGFLLRPFMALGTLLAKPFMALGSVIAKPFVAAGSFVAAKMSAMGTSIATGVKSAGSWMAKGIQTAGNTMSNGLKSAGNFVSGSLKKAGSFISGSLKNAGDFVSGKFGKMFSGKGGILAKMSGIASSMGSKIGSIGGGAVGRGASAAGGALKGVGGVLGKGLKFLGPIGAAAGVLISAADGFSQAEDIFGKNATFGNKISSTLGGIASGLTFGLLSTEDMAKGIQKVGDSISDASKATWEGLKSGASFIGDSLKNGASWYGNVLKSGADSILDVFGTSTTELQEGLTTAFTGLYETFTGIGEWLKDKVSGGVKSVKSFFGSMSGAFSKRRSEGGGFFDSLVSGAKGGLSSLSGDAKKRKTSLEQSAMAAGIKDPKELAMFMGQMSHESGNFTSMKEGKYNSDSVWKLRGKQLSAMGVSKDQVDSAYSSGGSTAMDEFMYSDKYRTGGNKMGNDKAGDATKYKGRGYTQLTGKKNYADMTKKLQAMGVNVDLVKNPELAEDPEIAAKIATTFWKTSGAQAQAKKGDLDGVSQAINGGQYGKSNGREDRNNQTSKFYAEYSKGTPAPTKTETKPTTPVVATTSKPTPVAPPKTASAETKPKPVAKAPVVATTAPIIKETSGVESSAQGKKQRATVEIQKSMAETAKGGSPLEQGLASAPSGSAGGGVKAPKSVSAQTPVAQPKSTVGDSDLLLLSGVFLNR